MFAYDEGAGVRQRACGVAVGNLHETLILPSQLYILSVKGEHLLIQVVLSVGTSNMIYQFF